MNTLPLLISIAITSSIANSFQKVCSQQTPLCDKISTTFFANDRVLSAVRYPHHFYIVDCRVKPRNEFYSSSSQIELRHAKLYYGTCTFQQFDFVSEEIL